MTKAVTNVPTKHFNSLVKAIRYPKKRFTIMRHLIATRLFAQKCAKIRSCRDGSFPTRRNANSLIHTPYILSHYRVLTLRRQTTLKIAYLRCLCMISCLLQKNQSLIPVSVYDYFSKGL